MRLVLLTILSCAFASAHPGEGRYPGKGHEKEPGVKVTKIWNGGVGGGVNGDIGIGIGGGCNPAACDAEVRYTWASIKIRRGHVDTDLVLHLKCKRLGNEGGTCENGSGLLGLELDGISLVSLSILAGFGRAI